MGMGPCLSAFPGSNSRKGRFGWNRRRRHPQPLPSHPSFSLLSEHHAGSPCMCQDGGSKASLVLTFPLILHGLTHNDIQDPSRRKLQQAPALGGAQIRPLLG
ncbi:hypothetical protein SETIT_6G162400v2 [Setaria italica]|uniref:Uncharacterized protein n=1 Tax=Setaria italica TaxID=4555 RepID=A0A368RM28_SETIT|nr:hypothetical protein SETIT_6G162400v2 [Setaria italica]